jgi:hypothetical protein
MGMTMIDISCGFKQVRLPDDFGQTYLKRCKSEKSYELCSSPLQFGKVSYQAIA